MNVLVLQSTLGLGGVENLLSDVFTRLDPARFGVTFCTLYAHGPVGARLLEQGCRVEHSFIRKKYDPRAFTRLRQVIRRDHIDVIYLATQPLTLFWGLLAAKSCGLPVVCLIGSTLDIRALPKLRVLRILLPFTDAIVAQAETQRRHLVDSQRFPERLLRVVHNGLDPAAFERPVDRAAKLRSLGLPANARVVGMVGRMVWLKGVDVLLHAFERLAASRPGVHLVVAGAGPDLATFEQMASSLGLRDRVHFLGRRDDLAEIVQLYDVAVLCSRTEAFPMVLLEYMAARRPVVAANVGNVSEVVENGVTGLLVDPEHPQQLAAAASRFLDDPDLAGRCADSGHALVVQRFRIEHTVAGTESVLTDVVRRRRAAR